MATHKIPTRKVNFHSEKKLLFLKNFSVRNPEKFSVQVLNSKIFLLIFVCFVFFFLFDCTVWLSSTRCCSFRFMGFCFIFSFLSENFCGISYVLECLCLFLFEFFLVTPWHLCLKKGRICEAKMNKLKNHQYRVPNASRKFFIHFHKCDYDEKRLKRRT